MKKIVRIFVFLIVSALISAILISCASVGPNYSPIDTMMPDGAEGENDNEFSEITENPFLKVSEHPSSSFAVTVSTAAYSNLRRYINEGRAIDKNQIKIEEIINYFKYDYPAPEDGKPLSISTGFFDCPWNQNAKLMTVGLRAEEVETSQIKNNLVFLLDVSGSMNRPDKLGLMQSAFLLLLDNLGENDKVSIVTYAGSNRVLLSGVSGANKTKISAVIESLSAGGSTAGADGIVTAYSLAEKYFIQGGNNRVILATDGNFNVGVSSNSGLERLISKKRESGVYLTVLGFGFGNLKSNKMETLANKGNGSFAYIDTINEARKVLVEEIGGTLHTVARDTKARVEFNPDYVDSYRLLGYENLLLTEEQWEENETDAGEIGSGFTVTAVYEVVFTQEAAAADETFYEVKVRYKSPDITNDTVNEISITASQNEYYSNPSEDMLFISALVEVSLLLRNSNYKGTADIDSIIERVNGLDTSNVYRAEFKELLTKIKQNYS